MKVAIILNSPTLDVEVKEEYLIFADAGYRFKEQLKDKKVLAVVGDFDSLGSIPKNEPTTKLPEEKDFTDGEVAVRLAKEKGVDEIVIYGGFKGKFDHALGNVALLKIAKDLGLKASIKEKDCSAFLLDGNVVIECNAGARLSLIAYGGNSKVINSKGLYYPLNNLTLGYADTRGLSNKTTDDKFELEIANGQLLAILYE